VRAWLARHGLAAHRGRGQNFLCDAALAARLVADAGVARGDSVLEIGSGLGILTRALAERARRVVSVEVDAGLVRALRAEGGLPSHVELVHADALELDLAALLAAEPAPRRLVASLPYAVATPLLRRFLDLRELLASWSVVVQRELAARILGRPGGADYGSLAVLHALAARARRGVELPPRCFHPVPRVTSTFVHLAPRRDPWLGAQELARVERLVRAAFAHRRKTLVNSLQQACAVPPPAAALAAALARLGIPPRARAEDVPPDAWRALAAALAPPSEPAVRCAGSRHGAG
jgi:16S rRNA (adenine1518-N6/adenine1519-N6)-dimethyltransferase